MKASAPTKGLWQRADLRFHRRGAHRASVPRQRLLAVGAEAVCTGAPKAPLVYRARKGALPVAEQATAAVGQPFALAARSAGREGLTATRSCQLQG